MIEMTVEKELSVTCEQRDAMDIECARLEKEVEALRKDAARYRAWRKIVSTFPTCRPCNTPEQTAVRQMAGHDFLKESTIDAYIDAAIREQGANNDSTPN